MPRRTLTTPTYVRLTNQTHEALTKYAEDHNVSIADIVEYICRVSFGLPTQFEGLHPKPLDITPKVSRYGITK